MRKNGPGNPDGREKARELSPAEQVRLARFEALSEEMEQKGYRRTELTISIVRANVFALLLVIPLAGLGFWLFWLKNRAFRIGHAPGATLVFFLVFAALVVIHELIHGASWALFTGSGFREIEFGVMKQYLTPYCTCGVPLSRGQYVFGALMPLVLLGLIPMAAGILLGSMRVLLMGILMADAAAGDILIVWKILRYRSPAEHVTYIDHPTQGGGVIFEK